MAVGAGGTMPRSAMGAAAMSASLSAHTSPDFFTRTVTTCAPVSAASTSNCGLRARAARANSNSVGLLGGIDAVATGASALFGAQAVKGKTISRESPSEEITFIEVPIARREGGNTTLVR